MNSDQPPQPEHADRDREESQAVDAMPSRSPEERDRALRREADQLANDPDDRAEVAALRRFLST